MKVQITNIVPSLRLKVFVGWDETRATYFIRVYRGKKQETVYNRGVRPMELPNVSDLLEASAPWCRLSPQIIQQLSQAKKVPVP